MYANFPQRKYNPLRLRELAMQCRKLGKFRHSYRYKGTKTRANDKINYYLFLLLTTNSHGWTRILRLKRQLGTTKKTTRTTLFLAKERWLALLAFCVSLEVTCYKQASASSFSRYTTDYRQVIISLRKENSALRLSYSEERRFCEAYARRLAHGGYRQLIVES